MQVVVLGFSTVGEVQSQILPEITRLLTHDEQVLTTLQERHTGMQGSQS